VQGSATSLCSYLTTYSDFVQYLPPLGIFVFFNDLCRYMPFSDNLHLDYHFRLFVFSRSVSEVLLFSSCRVQDRGRWWFASSSAVPCALFRRSVLSWGRAHCSFFPLFLGWSSLCLCRSRSGIIVFPIDFFSLIFLRCA
jgi:hypothetical protein